MYELACTAGLECKSRACQFDGSAKFPSRPTVPAEPKGLGDDDQHFLNLVQGLRSLGAYLIPLSFAVAQSILHSAWCGGVGSQCLSWQQSGVESKPDCHHAGYRALGADLVGLIIPSRPHSPTGLE